MFSLVYVCLSLLKFRLINGVSCRLKFYLTIIKFEIWTESYLNLGFVNVTGNYDNTKARYRQLERSNNYCEKILLRGASIKFSSTSKTLFKE